MGNYRLINGLILDGTGKQAFPGIVDIIGERISAIIPTSNVTGSSHSSFDGTEINCKGMYISPGFIDVHSHTDFNIIADITQKEKLSQGITTVLGGMCGLGLFPLNDEVTRYYSLYGRQLFGLENPPLFGSAKEFLDYIEHLGNLGINFGTFIPQGNIRAVVMGATSATATSDHIRLMQKMITQYLDEGAFGLSAGLIYPPGIFTNTAELIELCRVVAEKDAIFSCHMRDEANHIMDSIREMEQIQREAGCKVNISHLKIGASINARKRKPVSRLFQSYLAEKLPITADMYPYGWGFTSLSAIALPPWVFEGSDIEIRERILNPTIQTRLIQEFLNKMAELAGLPIIKKIPKTLLLKIAAIIFSRIARIVGLKNHPERQGLMLGEYLVKYYPSGTFFEKVFQMLADEDCAITIAMKTMDEKNVLEPLWQLPNVMMGTDSMTPLYLQMGTHPRAFGTTGKVLGTFTRDHQLTSWELAIHKMTGLPASVFQIDKRGVLASQYYADIVVFDPTCILDFASFQNCRQICKGIEYVFVNGTLSMKNCEIIEQSGKVLRKMNLK